MSRDERALRLEDSTIQPIGSAERHGSARDLFTVWFGSNLMLLTIVTGALAVTDFGLPFGWAVASLALGNFVGAVFMALHAAQGPRLGVPQMVQTRGQFGSLGSLLVVGLVVIMYVGFLASNLVLGAEAVVIVVPTLHDGGALALVGVLSVGGAILGYDLIHAYARVMTVVSGLALLAAFIWIAAVHGLPADFSHGKHATGVGILGATSIAALWQIAYAPYVSDYSRYLPAGSGERAAFWASYWGCTLGSLLPMVLGCLVVSCAVDANVVQTLALLTGGIAPVVLTVFALGVAENNAMNLYCGTLSALTIGQTLLPAWSPRAWARTIAALILFSAALVLALLARDSFLANYTDFILLLLYALVPWTAINLIDYYLIHRGNYDVESFLQPDGGIYGRVNLEAVACYFLGILVQVPFMSSPMYKGPVATVLAGADLSWIVGLLVTSPVYYLAARLAARRRVATMSAASPRTT